MTTATLARKTARFDRAKVRVIQNTPACWTIIDGNRSSRCTAEVISRGSRGYACRIDVAGQPRKYADDMRVESPEAAFELCRAIGTYQECWNN